MKLHENVITTLNLTFLIVKNLWRHQFAYISIIFAAGRHVSAKNTSVTRILVKIDLQVRLTCMTHHSLAKELTFPLEYVSTKFGGFMTSWKLLTSAEVQFREFWRCFMIFLTKKCVGSLGGYRKYKIVIIASNTSKVRGLMSKMEYVDHFYDKTSKYLCDVIMTSFDVIMASL